MKKFKKGDIIKGKPNRNRKHNEYVVLSHYPNGDMLVQSTKPTKLKRTGKIIYSKTIINSWYVDQYSLVGGE